MQMQLLSYFRGRPFASNSTSLSSFLPHFFLFFPKPNNKSSIEYRQFLFINSQFFQINYSTSLRKSLDQIPPSFHLLFPLTLRSTLFIATQTRRWRIINKSPQQLYPYPWRRFEITEYHRNSDAISFPPEAIPRIWSRKNRHAFLGPLTNHSLTPV